MTMMSTYSFNIYTDGSVQPKNPGPGGFAGVLEYPESWDGELEEIFQDGCFELTTITRMELMACIEAMRWVKKNGRNLRIHKAIIYTDSKHVHDCLGLAERWRANGWSTKEGRLIENKDLWKEFLSVRSSVGVSLEILKVSRRSSDATRLVDNLAKQAAKKSIKRKDYGYHPGAITKTKMPKTAAILYPANGQEAIIRIEGSSIKRARGREEYKITFVVFDEDKSEYIAKYYAYALREVEAELHRTHRYRVIFNDLTRYPIIISVKEEVSLGA